MCVVLQLGFGAHNLVAVSTFFVAYVLTVTIELLINLTVLGAAKVQRGLSQTALGHGAALTAIVLAVDGALDRDGLTREAGFTGALGKYCFLADGRCQRDLAVLTIEAGEIVTIGEVTGT